jgi:RNA polymerase sigma factor (TIGR02999 family)
LVRDCAWPAAGGKLRGFGYEAVRVKVEGTHSSMSAPPDEALPVPDEQHGVGDVTALLRRAHVNRRDTLDALVPIVYDTLRHIARQQLAGERRGHTLTATALAHEAYTRLVGLTRIEWRDRAHFFAAAAGAMRRVLIDYAAARNAHKRGGGAVAVELDLVGIVADDHLDELLSVNDALQRLETVHAGAARVVECRVFAGMTIEEAAAALRVSPATVKRHWELARAWLGKHMKADR